MPRLFLDFETFSEADIRKTGMHYYSAHPSTEPLMLAWAINNDPPKIVTYPKQRGLPKELRQALYDPEITKSAWNAQFEMCILRNCLGVETPFEQWIDTAAVARYASLPSSLDKASKALGFSEDKTKMAEGKKLIRKFCVPKRPPKNPEKSKKAYYRENEFTEPDDWELFKQYCLQDVVTEREVARYLLKVNFPDHEKAWMRMDWGINLRGIPITRRGATAASSLFKRVTEERIDYLKEITGLSNPNSRDQLLKWVTKEGYQYSGLTKAHVSLALEAKGGVSEDGREALNVRQEIGQSAPAKYAAILNGLMDDDTLKGCFIYSGASRTHRWTGERFQPQNLVKPSKAFEDILEDAVEDLETLGEDALLDKYDDPFGLLSSCVRPMAKAPDGYVFCDADLNAIENRVLGWIAEEDKILKVFREKKDPYIAFGEYFYGMSYDELYAEYKAGNKDKRTICKPGVLGCGYMLSSGQIREDRKTGEKTGTGLIGYALSMGIELTQDQASYAVDVFRKNYSKVKRYWGRVDDAFRATIRRKKGDTQVGVVNFSYSNKMDAVVIELPSGSNLFYLSPKLSREKMPWGEMKTAISYMGVNDKRQWGKVTTHPGKITENIDQSISRDILAYGMQKGIEEGLDIRMHIHDQWVVLAKEEDAEETLKKQIRIMEETPPWAKGLPLGAEGNVSKVFTKG